MRGVIAALDGLQATIKGVSVQGKDVDGDVEGVRLISRLAGPKPFSPRRDRPL